MEARALKSMSGGLTLGHTAAAAGACNGSCRCTGSWGARQQVHNAARPPLAYMGAARPDVGSRARRRRIASAPERHAAALRHCPPRSGARPAGAPGRATRAQARRRRHTMAWLTPSWNLRRCSRMRKGSSRSSASSKCSAGGRGEGGGGAWPGACIAHAAERKEQTPVVLHLPGAHLPASAAAWRRSTPACRPAGRACGMGRGVSRRARGGAGGWGSVAQRAATHPGCSCTPFPLQQPAYGRSSHQGAGK